MSTIAHSSSVATPAALSISAPTKRNHRTPPPIPPDKEPQLYNAFFDGESSLVDIAREFNLSVTHLVAWTAQKHVQNLLLDVAELGRTRARLIASEGSSRAVHTLDTISTFHQSDTGDAKTTNAHAKRRDVSRKSATDTLKIGLHPLRDLFNYCGTKDTDDDPTNPDAPNPTPRGPNLSNLPPRAPTASAHLRAIAGTASLSTSNHAAGSPAAPGNRPRDSSDPTPLARCDQHPRRQRDPNHRATPASETTRPSPLATSTPTSHRPP